MLSVMDLPATFPGATPSGRAAGTAIADGRVSAATGRCGCCGSGSAAEYDRWKDIGRVIRVNEFTADDEVVRSHGHHRHSPDNPNILYAGGGYRAQGTTDRRTVEEYGRRGHLEPLADKLPSLGATSL
jgi:hypothetical protein